jgi:hypothetical protein
VVRTATLPVGNTVAIDLDLYESREELTWSRNLS